MTNISSTSPLSLPILILNLFLGLCISMILAGYYLRYGNSLSNRNHFAALLPLLTLITLLVISIVKSSLALSLGLVGALSIVRFRAAIKEPEELAFLFLAISIGLGLGAGQALVTVVALIVILGLIAVRSLISKAPEPANLYLTVTSIGQG